jgi:hypothetical protein
LGKELGILVLPGQEGHKVRVLRGEETPVVQWKKFHLRAADCLAAIFWGTMVCVSPLLLALLLLSE